MKILHAFDSPERIKYPFPTSDELEQFLLNATTEELKQFVRLWLTEGLPHAFKHRPSLYEEVRDWFAELLEVSAKEITLIGSGRMGYSLASGDFGRKFTEGSSDLDFSIISSSLFERLTKDFEVWWDNWTKATITASSNTEKRRWEYNAELVRNNVDRGFINPHLVPTCHSSRWVRATLNACWAVHERLKKTEDAPRVSKIGVRVYRNWDALVTQGVLSVNRLRRSFMEQLSVS